MAKKIGPDRAAKMTEKEIARAVFAGASTREPRGLSDAFTLPGIQAVASNEDAGHWRWVALGTLDAETVTP